MNQFWQIFFTVDDSFVMAFSYTEKFHIYKWRTNSKGKLLSQKVVEAASI